MCSRHRPENGADSLPFDEEPLQYDDDDEPIDERYAGIESAIWERE